MLSLWEPATYILNKLSTNSSTQQITGQKRKKGMVFMVFSFQHYLSFVERFVENMLSRKYLMFNTSFIIFNNSTKIRGVLSVIFMNRTHPLQVRMSCLCFSTYSRQYDSAKPTNKQEDIQLKAVVPPLNCRTMTLLFSFAPYNFFMMVSRNRTAP